MSCQPIIFPPCPTVECPEQIVYASQNGNLNGVGVLDSNTASLGTFRGVNGDGQYISTTLDAANLSITVSLIAAAIPAAIPQATETVAGKGEVATSAETVAGTSDSVFITPAKLAGLVANTIVPGLIEIATQGEANTGLSATLAITPLTLQGRLAAVMATRVFANAAARAAATPDFDGQVGVQLDTELVYTATGLAAGNWQSTYIQANTSSLMTADTEIDVDPGITLDFSTQGDPVLTIIDYTAQIRSLSTLVINGGAFLDLKTTAQVQVNGVTVPANSVVATSGTAGQITSKLIADFISTSNLQTGWGTPTGTLDRTTFDDTITLPELAQRVAALVTDLKAKLLPAT